MSASKLNPLTPRTPLPSQVVKDDEGSLVAAAKAGDITAFETLVGRYERKIFRLAQNITQNKEDAEDVMQEAFLKSYQHLGEFQGNSRFYTWLVRIAVNQALMKLRKRRPNQVSARRRSGHWRRYDAARGGGLGTFAGGTLRASRARADFQQHNCGT